MLYWPMSVVKSSPLMPPAFAWELFQVYKTCYLSEPAFQACGAVARDIAPREMHHLAIIETIGGPPRQIYTSYPDWEDWLRLERGAVVERETGLYVFIDALH